MGIILLLLMTFLNSSDPVGLRVGDKAPSFSVEDQNGKVVQLDEVLKEGNVILTFYRGSWCRYCMKQFKDYQDSLSFYTAKNATLIAITPQYKAGITKTVEISKATFSILYDFDMSIMEAYGVISKDKVVDYRKNYMNSEEDISRKFVPVPATYIINQKGVIEYVYFDPNYRVRISNKDLLEHL